MSPKRFADKTKLFLKLEPSITDTTAFSQQLAAALKSHPSTSKLQLPQLTYTTRGAVLRFPSQAARWTATDNQEWLDSLLPNYTARVSERRTAIVLSHVPPIDVPASDWGVFGESGKSHPELHPRWFRFLEGLNPIRCGPGPAGEQLVYRIRKVELLGKCPKRGLALAVWFHDREIADWFLQHGSFQFGCGAEYRISDIERKIVKGCGRCGKGGHATANCREVVR